MKTRIQEFFSRHERELQASYPGLRPERLVQEFEGGDLDLFFAKLLQGIPLAHISGKAFFYNSTFQVSPDVLIPRFETEILVELVVNELKARASKGPLRWIDVGTGPGTILLAVAKELPFSTEALGIDISEKALALARANERALAPEFDCPQRVTWQLSDRLEGVKGAHALIVSNPPYIKAAADRGDVHPQVLAHEPELALFLPDEGYTAWFETFFSSALGHLEEGGVFLMEGHEKHLDDLAILAQNLKASCVSVIPDLTGRPRFLKFYR